MAVRDQLRRQRERCGAYLLDRAPPREPRPRPAPCWAASLTGWQRAHGGRRRVLSRPSWTLARPNGRTVQCFDWRYYLVKYPSMREGDTGIYYGVDGEARLLPVHAPHQAAQRLLP